MPARSQAQRAYLNAHFGHAWVKAHGFDNAGKLPEHVQHPDAHKMGPSKEHPMHQNEKPAPGYHYWKPA